MRYVLAVDLGTTYTAAALRDSSSGSVEILGLGNRAAQIPSVLYRQPDASFLVGEPAERRGLIDPVHVVREFKRRIGDTVPILLAGAPYSPQALTAVLLRWVVGEATERLGRPPELVVLTHPANWTNFKIDLLSEAAALAGLPDVTMRTEPAAAARQYAEHHPTNPGDRVCVFDLGGGTFDAAVLERTPTGFDVLGAPGGIEQLGGIDFDEAIFGRVLTDGDIDLADVDPGDPTTTRGLARLRRDCVDAKEALSTDTDTVITARRAATDIEVRVTRSEFEDLIRPAVRSCIDATDRVLRAANTTPDQLAAFVLVGGSSRIPLVTETLISTYHRTVARTTHPKHDVALGAAATPTATVPVTPLRPADPAPDATDEKPSRTVVTPEPIGAAPVEANARPGASPAETASPDRYQGIAQQPEPPVIVIEPAEPAAIPDPVDDVQLPHGDPFTRTQEPAGRTDQTSPADTTARQGTRSRARRRGIMLTAALAVILIISVGVMFILTRPAAADPVSSWGSGASGQLGNGTTTGSAVPVPVSDLSGVTALAAGFGNGYALLQDGTVRAWGGGQLGNGTTTGSAVPVPVSGLTGVTALAVGFGTGYALLKDGTVSAWGEGGRGRLGNGTTAESLVPVPVSGLTGVTAVAAGFGNGYALLQDGTVMAWGIGEGGALGNGTTTDSPVPVPVSGLSGVTAVAAGGMNGYALLLDGTVMAWGSGASGQLGNGTTTGSLVPVPVSNLTGVTAIAAGGFFVEDRIAAYALLQDGTVMAWGNAGYGRLGNPSADTPTTIPVPVSGLTGVTAIAAGETTAYALLQDGTVRAWGNGADGQLGNGVTGTSSPVPVPVSNLTGATGIVAGANTAYALLTRKQISSGRTASGVYLN